MSQLLFFSQRRKMDVSDSDSEDEEDKARKEEQKKAFFDQSVSVADSTTFEQLQLSRPLLKVPYYL